MKEGQPAIVRREGYTPPSHWIDEVALRVELAPRDTRVHATLKVRRNPAVGEATLRLDGAALELLEVRVDGRVLGGNEYQRDDEGLTLFGLPEACEVACTTRIDPEANTSLEGLYLSNGMFCTQCEAEGFRKITYFLDRPDVMARYRTTIVADATALPVLLSNGNKVAQAVLADGRTEVTWEDPFPKPSYLFALVGGDLALLEDEFVTMSGRRVRLCIYSEPHNIGQCDYAMGALQRSMRWDEERFGREYDLDIYMIVAVDHFNMGAMENKGLNVFNTNCVLARADTTTDAGFQRVESVVAHEYFHNWSGNRVTCRDWFQLSLKEGFTVYRDQEFSSDIGSRTVQRIADVDVLRSGQFPEDAGPMAHPVRPESYIEISNFYTATVYQKGAEVVRMLETLLGRDGFRQGSDLYFERHDGQAATCEDFVRAMEDATGTSLAQFRHWYSEAGTPRLEVDTAWDAAARALTLQVRQSLPGRADAPALHLPLAIGLLDADGRALHFDAVDAPVVSGGELPTLLRGDTAVLQVTQGTGTWRIDGLARAPVVSLLRGFSAPVRLEKQRGDDELSFLMLHDTDGFCRWDAAQAFHLRIIDRHVRGEGIADIAVAVARGLLARARVAPDDGDAKAQLTAMLALPSVALLCEQYDPMPVDAIVAAHDALSRHLAQALRGDWEAVFAANAPRAGEAYAPEPAQVARRGLRNLAQSYLALLDDDGIRAGLAERYDTADNMTDRLATLRAIVDHPHPAGDALRERALADFLQRNRHEALVMDLWLTVQATCPRPGGVARVQALAEHPVFDAGVPNKVRALFNAFANRNVANFHAADGSGYQLVAGAVRSLDGRNPQVAARLARTMSAWRRLPPARGSLLRAALADLAATDGLSRDVYEVVSRSLADAG